ncbi:MAG TPA: class I SAM-dependent methyltransferase [Polyangia bacterium]|nr:class I SAM-dependent methyltransferase [Polyangia bacterium]
MAEAHDATALVERLFGAALGGFDLVCVYIGDRLGLYRALAGGGPMTASGLAHAAGVHPRYAREWLEQQAMSGILSVDDPDLSDDERRYDLPSAHAEVLLDELSMNFMTPIAQLFVACTGPLAAVLDAFRSGGGVPYADYGPDLHEGQARFSRVLFDNLLTGDWLPAVPGVHERLRAEPPARVADIACGLGRSTVAMARGYPLVRVDGIDLDEASIIRANELLAIDARTDLGDRVTFIHGDAASADLAGAYDLVTIFEALHDMSHPVAALRAARGLLRDGGVVLIGDEMTADRFSPDAGDIERLYYGFSVTHCLPVGMVGVDPAGTGTVMRADTVARYAREAGFGACEVLPIENDFWRFYLLRQ